MSDRVTSEKLNAAEREQRYWKMKRDALVLRNEYETQNPEMFQGAEKRLGAGKPTPMDQLEQAHVRGAAMRMYEKGYSGGNDGDSKAKTSPGEIAASRQRTIEALVKSGKSDAEIQAFIEKTSGYVDAMALAGSDPMMASILFSKTMSGGNQQLTMRDMIETIRLAQDLRGPNKGEHQSEIAQVIQALTQYNRGSGDPSQTFNTAANVLGPMYAQMNQANKESSDRYLDLLREQMDRQSSNNPLDYLRQLKEGQDIVGKLAGKESETIQAKRLELDHEKWKASMEADTERKKTAGQTDMVKTIVGNLSKALENPVIREAGRGIGQALGKTSPRAGAVVNAVAGAPQAAARTELNTPPTQVPWGLVCHKCQTQHTFTQLQLAQIEESGGRWSCGKCGEVYELRRPPEGGESSGGT